MLSITRFCGHRIRIRATRPSDSLLRTATTRVIFSSVDELPSNRVRVTNAVRGVPAAIVAAGIVLCGTSLCAAAVVTVHNELPIAPPSETIELSVPGDLDRVHIFEDDREILAQSLDLDADGKPESLIFQADM